MLVDYTAAAVWLACLITKYVGHLRDWMMRSRDNVTFYGVRAILEQLIEEAAAPASAEPYLTFLHGPDLGKLLSIRDRLEGARPDPREIGARPIVEAIAA